MHYNLLCWNLFSMVRLTCNNSFYSEKWKEEQITTDYTTHLKKQQNYTKTTITGVLCWALDFILNTQTSDTCWKWRHTPDFSHQPTCPLFLLADISEIFWPHTEYQGSACMSSMKSDVPYCSASVLNFTPMFPWKTQGCQYQYFYANPSTFTFVLSHWLFSFELV